VIVVMQQRAEDAATARVVRRLEAAGLGAYVFHGEERNVIAVLGVGEDEALRDELASLPGVERVDWTTRPFRLASREVRPGGTSFVVGPAPTGGTTVSIGRGLSVIAGASRPRQAQDLVALARATRDAGAAIFWVGRGDSGELRRDLLSALDEVRAETGLPVVVDVWEPVEVDRLSRHADALMIPGQQMTNFPLVKEVGQGDRPMLVCRGPSATIEEWLMVAERGLQAGNMRVALCEQGIRTFEPSVHATLDFSAIPMTKRLSHLPVLANPSLAAGHHDLVPELSLAATAAGADGLLLDVHLGGPEDGTWGPQSMPVGELGALVRRLEATRAALS
jgi:3-deoxy-7-phosphoheptulonate synthase